MRCCLCHKEIEVLKNKEGNNTEPLKKGRCCDICNNTKVIPERIKRMLEARNKTPWDSLSKRKQEALKQRVKDLVR